MVEVPIHLAEEGLDAFEFQAVRMGMPDQKVSVGRAETLRRNAEKSGVSLTIHGPYFINLSAERAETYEMSIKRLVSSMRLASWMRAHQVVFHPGYYGKFPRERALDIGIEALQRVVDAVQNEGIRDVWLGPETTGKINQLGDVEEIIKMCESVEQVRPTIDFAHIHARGLGKIRSKEDYARIIDLVEGRLGGDVVRNLHVHYTRVEFTEKGERKHHTMDETEYGPDFEPLAKLIVELGLSPTIISESPLLDQDSIRMRDMVRVKLRAK